LWIHEGQKKVVNKQLCWPWEGNAKNTGETRGIPSRALQLFVVPVETGWLPICLPVVNCKQIVFLVLLSNIFGYQSSAHLSDIIVK